ncbi:Chromosomal replication initiator protein DnaA [hydrothermal vent metagenome]|uniref:Chromosomal replication initiator protein DnaA n=1 Tax=hydrothermal vent metagenome TaxID=652676 RepID=A0A3B0YA46_9ZZZZ
MPPDEIKVQIPLGVSLSDTYTFDNFLPAANGLVTKSLLDCLQEDEFQFIFLWGAKNSGKSHLLQACCAQAASQGESASYTPCHKFHSAGSNSLEGLDNMRLVCIDSIDKVAGKPDWEETLFALYNALRDHNGVLIVSAEHNILECGFQLPDLLSRMQWGLSLRLLLLTDEEKTEALMLRCQIRGIDINIDVINWLIKHITRDMESLYQFMDQAIEQAIKQGRRITIPFIKSLEDGQL